MRKTSCKHFSTIVLALILLIGSFSCIHFSSKQRQKKYVFAEGEVVSYSLVPANYYEDPNKQSKYNLGSSNLDSFTPFDFVTGERMPGDAFKLPVDEYEQIIDQYVKLEYHNDIVKSDDLSIVLWIYIDGNLLYDLSLTLELENGVEILYELSSTELTLMLEKNNQETYLPYAYNKFSFPLSSGTFDGEIYNGNFLYAPTKLTINYSSVIPEEQREQDFAGLYFYDIRIEEVNNQNIAVIEKQNYYISGFNLMPTDVAESICVGDKYKIPLLSQVVNYAYKGKENILQNFHDYSWRVRVIVPDDNATQIIYNYGENITFEKEGVYKIYYECIHSEDDKIKVDLYARDDVYVNTINGIYFMKDKLNVVVGDKYLVGINTSSLFKNVSDIVFEYDHDALDVSLGESGRVVVKAKKTGTYRVVAKVNGNRVLNMQMQEYQTEIEIVARNAENKSDHKIFIIVSLSVIGLTILISLVILVVKSRKIVVK